MFEEWISPSSWPWPLSIMVDEARRIISYFENLPKDQQPPKSIWHSVIKCNKFIEDNSPFKNNRPGGGMIQLDEDDIQR